MMTARYILYGGTMAAAASLAVLAMAAKAEGRGALQPVNATSHWLHGDKAAAVATADLPHTGIGAITHAASAAFWAVPFACWLAMRPPRSPSRMLCEAGLLSAFAAVFDYGVVPKRLTPGWELVLSRRSVAAAFAAIAFGLAAGGLAAQRGRRAAGPRELEHATREIFSDGAALDAREAQENEDKP